MPSDEPFEEVLRQLRLGEGDAALEVYNRFAERLTALARTQLDRRLRQRVDPEDVVQSVMRTVFVRLADGQFVLGDWDNLWGLLARITVCKCHKWKDHFHAQKRDITREAQRPEGETPSAWEVAGREPAPPEVLVLTETVELLLHGLDEREQRILTLSLDGHNAEAISAVVGCTESKVYRVLRIIRGRLERMHSESVAGS